MDPSQGLRGYIAHYFKPYKALFPINVIEEIAKPLTLALRLFGNIFSGGIMLLLIWALLPVFVVPFADLIWKIFDGLFVAVRAGVHLLAAHDPLLRGRDVRDH